MFLVSVNLYALNDGNRDKTLRNLCSLQSTINLAVGVSHTAVREEFHVYSLDQKFTGFYQTFWRTAAISLLDWVSSMSADNIGAARFREEMQRVSPAISLAAWSFAIKNYQQPEQLPPGPFSYFDKEPNLAELKLMLLSKFKPDNFSYGKAPKGAQLFYRQELKKILDEANLWSDSDIKDAAAGHLLNESGQTIIEEYNSLIKDQTKTGNESFDHRVIALEILQANK